VSYRETTASRGSSFPPLFRSALATGGGCQPPDGTRAGNEMQIARGHFSHAGGSEFLIIPRPVPAAPGCRIPLFRPHERVGKRNEAK